MRHFIRSIVLRLKWWTDSWIVTPEMTQAVDSGDFGLARKLLKEKEQEWGEGIDPELITYSTLISFFEDDLPE